MTPRVHGTINQQWILFPRRVHVMIGVPPRLAVLQLGHDLVLSASPKGYLVSEVLKEMTSIAIRVPPKFAFILCHGRYDLSVAITAGRYTVTYPKACLGYTQVYAAQRGFRLPPLIEPSPVRGP